MRACRAGKQAEYKIGDVLYRFIDSAGERGDTCVEGDAGAEAAGHPMGGGYFAAANSMRGFVSYFDELIERRCDRRMILKGGPGTGKSHFIRRAAEKAVERGGVVECYYCSSDPGSLDGMVALMPSGEVFGIQDGTAPHAADATLPGARDEIFDLGRFLRADDLRGERAEIEELGAAKSRAWERVFLSLAAAGRVREAQRLRLFESVDREKIGNAAARAAGDAERAALEFDAGSAWLMRSAFSDGKTAGVLHSPHRACTMRGCVALPGIYEGAREVFFTSDEPLPGMGELFITAMARRLESSARAGREIECRISPDPISPEVAVAVRCGSRVYTCDRSLPPHLAGNVARHRIGLRRFLKREGAGERYEICRLDELWRRAAAEAVHAAGEAAGCHFALESLYTAAMDFSALDAAGSERTDEFFR